MNAQRCLIAINGVFAVCGEMQRAHEITSLFACSCHLFTGERFGRGGVNLDEPMIFQERLDAYKFVRLNGFKISVQAKTAI